MVSETLPGAIFWLGGSLARVNRGKIDGEVRRGGVRGEIRSFSRSSRRRLLRTIAKLDRRYIPLFLTLTYPAEFPGDYRVWKKHVDTIGKRMVRRWGNVAILWRLEFQKRGAPDLHFLVWGVDYLEMLGWLSKAWFEVVGSGDLKHLVAGTQVAKVRSWRGVSSYVSKYMSKNREVDGSVVGRRWGIIGRKNLKWGKPVHVALSEREAQVLLRYVGRFARMKNRNRKTLTVFLDAEQWWNNLEKLLYPV